MLLCDSTDRATEHLLCHWAPEGAALQGARVVREVHQQVKTCGGRKELIPPGTKLVGAAQPILTGHELTPRAEAKG